MQKKISIFFLVLLFLSCSSARNLNSKSLAINSPISSTLFLNKIQNDRLPVEIDPGEFEKDSIIYRLPKVIQGTYEVSDFGNYIYDFNAYDSDGSIIKSSKIDKNSWIIYEGEKLDKITYQVEDTFDIENTDRTTPFSPAGTNIEEDNLMLNLHGFIGYFDDLLDNPYELKIIANKNFIRSSALPKISEYYDKDQINIRTNYFANRYFDITDNPMMYGNLDVEEIMVGDIKIVLSIYSPNNVHSAKSLKELIEKMMQAQKKYLGSIDSTKRYDIFLYLSELSDTSPVGLGALEHHTSTVVVLSEASSYESLSESIVDVVAHEFFHILTPLSIHSEDIHFFNYNNPTFSKHLWMYEGVTEYFAQHFQVNQGLVNKEKFYDEVMNKIRASMRYDDTMSFSKMSENILNKPYSENYYNVYLKGALIGMCIDILIRKETNGERGILWLMKELSNKYGKQKPFDDDQLFDEIISMSFSSVGKFIKDHIEGEIPINYNDFFELLGLELKDDNVETTYIQSDGELIFRADRDTDKIYFKANVSNNSFWVNQGVKPNDLFKSFKGEEVSLKNINLILTKMYQWKEGEEVSIVIEREGLDIIIKTTSKKTFMKAKNIFEISSPSNFQKNLRNSWLYN